MPKTKSRQLLTALSITKENKDNSREDHNVNDNRIHKTKTMSSKYRASINVKRSIHILKQRLRDLFINEWVPVIDCFLRTPKDFLRHFLAIVIFIPSSEKPVQMRLYVRKIRAKQHDIL